jgi:hypothetical protein
MAAYTQITSFNCPECHTLLEPPAAPETSCPRCRWKGAVWLFTPLTIQAEKAAQALPDDATCAHHPGKQAVAICQGTGDYICSLCAVELNGQTFSAQYLNQAGKEKFSKAFARYLDRPDRLTRTYLAASILCWPGAPLLVPLAFVQFFKILALRKKDPLYKRLVGSGHMIVLAIILGCFSILVMILIIAVVYKVTRG